MLVGGEPCQYLQMEIFETKITCIASLQSGENVIRVVVAENVGESSISIAEARSKRATGNILHRINA